MTNRSPARLQPSLEPARGSGGGYWDESHRPWAILLALLPLILICEFGLATWPADVPAVQVTAHRSLLQLFGSLALPPPVLLAMGGILTIVILLTWQSFSRSPWRAGGGTIGWMYIEGAAMALPLFVMSRFLLATPLAAGTELLETLPWFQRIVLSIAAGLYEELIFRMVLIAIIHTLLVDLMGLKEIVGPATPSSSAAAFAWPRSGRHGNRRYRLHLVGGTLSGLRLCGERLRHRCDRPRRLRRDRHAQKLNDLTNR